MRVQSTFCNSGKFILLLSRYVRSLFDILSRTSVFEKVVILSDPERIDLKEIFKLRLSTHKTEYALVTRISLSERLDYQ